MQEQAAVGADTRGTITVGTIARGVSVAAGDLAEYLDGLEKHRSKADEVIEDAHVRLCRAYGFLQISAPSDVLGAAEAWAILDARRELSKIRVGEAGDRSERTTAVLEALAVLDDVIEEGLRLGEMVV